MTLFRALNRQAANNKCRYDNEASFLLCLVEDIISITHLSSLLASPPLSLREYRTEEKRYGEAATTTSISYIENTQTQLRGLPPLPLPPPLSNYTRTSCRTRCRPTLDRDRSASCSGR